MPRRVPEQNDVIRLFDRVRAAYPDIPEVPVIVADDIQRQIDALPEAGSMSYPADWYGGVAPPFKGFFVESTVQIEDNGVSMVAQRGVFVSDMSDLVRERGLLPHQHPPQGWRFCLVVQGYTYMRPIGLQGHRDVQALIHLDDEGHILDDMEHVNILVNQRPGLTRKEVDLQSFATAGILPMALKAVSAMHQRCPVDEITPSHTAQRRARLRDKLDLHKYYVLRVRPTEAQRIEDFKRVGTPERTGSREHTVRGHFRWYGEHGLFGKHKNRMVWVPEHHRGDDTIGTIAKDYKV